MKILRTLMVVCLAMFLFSTILGCGGQGANEDVYRDAAAESWGDAGAMND
jgi:hypothetical protein